MGKIILCGRTNWKSEISAPVCRTSLKFYTLLTNFRHSDLQLLISSGVRSFSAVSHIRGERLEARS